MNRHIKGAIKRGPVEEPSQKDLLVFFSESFTNEPRCDDASKTAADDPVQRAWNSLPVAIYTSERFEC